MVLQGGNLGELVWTHMCLCHLLTHSGIAILLQYVH